MDFPIRCISALSVTGLCGLLVEYRTLRSFKSTRLVAALLGARRALVHSAVALGTICKTTLYRLITNNAAARLFWSCTATGRCVGLDSDSSQPALLRTFHTPPPAAPAPWAPAPRMPTPQTPTRSAPASNSCAGASRASAPGAGASVSAAGVAGAAGAAQRQLAAAGKEAGIGGAGMGRCKSRRGPCRWRCGGVGGGRRTSVETEHRIAPSQNRDCPKLRNKVFVVRKGRDCGCSAQHAPQYCLRRKKRSSIIKNPDLLSGYNCCRFSLVVMCITSSLAIISFVFFTAHRHNRSNPTTCCFSIWL